MNRELDITIDDPFEEEVSEEWLLEAVGAVMDAEAVDYPAALSLFITGDDTVQELNRNYRGIDETTDVLAFAFQEDPDFPVPPDSPVQLGEVIISCPQASRQAEEQGHSLNLEMAVLIIHGVLHLLGYDHEKEADELSMKTRETESLARLKD
ncbi:MAG: rRNA maturation RNase YbeY [Dehalococcoidia bacterium]